MAQLSLQELVAQSLESQKTFRSRWEDFPTDFSLTIDGEKAISILHRLEEKLTENYPFFNPRYAGQMLKPPHPIAIAAYLSAMQINPNNHALDGGPATAKMEMEVVGKIAAMFGYTSHLGHLTSSGTIANLEALWIAKSIHPNKAIAFSGSAHYTHQRMCEVIGARYVVLDSFDNLEEQIKEHSIGTIVVTMGTTSIGAVEPLHTIIPIVKKLNVRIHADAAYGGFFTLLARTQNPIIDARPFLELKNADSIVVDPHKHGLQPYGCGCVLFKDSSVGKYYKHDSPYTYFTSKELHLGEISLECSRAGASAAALWATLEYLPLESENGLGAVLNKTRMAAQNFSTLLASSKFFCEYTKPELDIVTYFPRTKNFSSSSVSEISENIFTGLMNHPTHPLYLATLNVSSQSIKEKYPDFVSDSDTTKILRSVLMKPEHLDFVPTLFRELETFAQKIV